MIAERKRWDLLLTRTSYTKRLSTFAAATLDLCWFDGHYIITRLYVPVAYRGLGHGADLLRWVCREADEVGAGLALQVSPYGGLDAGDLFAFYSRHGFISQDGRGHMVRHPKAKLIA